MNRKAMEANAMKLRMEADWRKLLETNLGKRIPAADLELFQAIWAHGFSSGGEYEIDRSEILGA